MMGGNYNKEYGTCRFLRLWRKTEKYMEKAKARMNTPTVTVRGLSISWLILYIKCIKITYSAKPITCPVSKFVV